MSLRVVHEKKIKNLYLKLIGEQSIVLSLVLKNSQIFSLLLHHANDGTKVERGVEREVAAALESVFPRISLKAFINLGAEEKGTQLDELANIVLGIRIFNQHIGKGGVNMPNPEQEVGVLLQSVGASLASEVEKSQQSCAELQEMVVHSHTHTNEDVTSEELCRWKDELANRRQYMSYLQSLQEDITVSERNVASLQENLASEISDLRELVGSRASVPKEHVYPKFYEIATQWTALCHEKRLITGRIRTAKILQTYSNSYKSSTRGTSHEFRQGNNVAQEGGEWDRGIAASSRGVTLNSKDKPSLSDDFAERNTGATSQDAVDMLQDRQNHGQLQDPNSPTAGTSSERPVKLSIESTPEFMQLPLEYQGFCPWTIVRRQGLLLPGKPELGVIRYTNRFFVFTHQSAINDFMDDPEHFINGALQRARISPELIHLLRLQDDFPDTSIMRILQGENNSRRRQSLALSKPERRDIGTETPTHFIAKDLQTGYHWNEWYLRRRALKVANLRNCATRSQQTDVSHIRRTNSTQIYLRREKATQTNRNSGSKPPRTVQYFKGKTRRNSLCMTPIGVSLDGTNETRGQPQLLKAQIGRRFELTALRGMCSRISAYSRLVIKCRRLRVTGEPNERHIRRTKYKSTLTEHWLVARCSGEPGASLQMN